MNVLRIGDTVQYRGGWGNDPPKYAVIEQLEVTAKPGEKYGIDVEIVDASLVRANRVVFGFTNGHWCYSDQVDL